MISDNGSAKVRKKPVKESHDDIFIYPYNDNNSVKLHVDTYHSFSTSYHEIVVGSEIRTSANLSVPQYCFTLSSVVTFAK